MVRQKELAIGVYLKVMLGYFCSGVGMRWGRERKHKRYLIIAVSKRHT